MCQSRLRVDGIDEDTRTVLHRTAGRLRSARIYVWEPNACEAFARLWSSERNTRHFNEHCLGANGEARYIPSLVDESFHYFPAGGMLFPDNVDAALRDPHCDAVFPPTTNALAIGHLVCVDLHVLPVMLHTIYLNPAKLPPDLEERMRILKSVRDLPARDVKYQPWLSTHVRVPTLMVSHGEFVGTASSKWLLPLYQMRIFLEQPCVGLRATRAHKVRSRKMGVPRNEEFTKVYMREDLGKKIPRFFLSKFSRVTGRKLEFEVSVRGHMRHCPSGKIVPVRPHKRGKLGVFKEKVVKVVR